MEMLLGIDVRCVSSNQPATVITCNDMRAPTTVRHMNRGTANEMTIYKNPAADRPANEYPAIEIIGPRIVLVVDGYAQAKVGVRSNFVLQTTVSQRLID